MFIIEQHGTGATCLAIRLKIVFHSSWWLLKINLGIRLTQFPIVLVLNQTFGVMHDLFHGGIQRWKADTNNMFILDELNMGCVTGNGMSIEGI